MTDQWIIAPYHPEWKQLFLQTGTLLRHALQKKAIRIDHIGSTSVEGLDAKPIIDIQISVPDYRKQFYDDRARYVEGKGPIVWDILQKAHAWSQQAGWEPGPSDL